MSKGINIENLYEITNKVDELKQSLDSNLQSISSSLHDIKNTLTGDNYDNKTVKVQIEPSHDYCGAPKFKFGQFVKVTRGFYEGMTGKILKVASDASRFNLIYTVQLAKKELEVDATVDEDALEEANAIDYMKDKKENNDALA